MVVDVLNQPQLAEDEKILATESSPEDIRRNMHGLGWDRRAWERAGQ
jgi:hypothetical protein